MFNHSSTNSINIDFPTLLITSFRFWYLLAFVCTLRPSHFEHACWVNGRFLFQMSRIIDHMNLFCSVNLILLDRGWMLITSLTWKLILPRKTLGLGQMSLKLGTIIIFGTVRLKDYQRYHFIIFSLWLRLCGNFGVISFVFRDILPTVSFIIPTLMYFSIW